MDINLENVKDIASIAHPFISKLYETIITPQIEKLKELLKKENRKNQIADNFFENKFNNYLKLKYQEFNNVNILAFQNEQIQLKDIYYPLTVSCSADSSTNIININSYEFVESYKRILITDSAGMGKSTISKWIALDILESGLSIPILITLRNLNPTRDLFTELHSQLNGFEEDINKELFIDFLKLGNFTIILDGFDEIGDEYASTVIYDIKKLITLAPDNYFVLSSRPENAISSFGEFQRFSIKELEVEESFELIHKYDKLNKNKFIANELIHDIKTGLGQAKEFLKNPFLTSLLYRTYRFNGDIPSKKYTFYEEVISALYKSHDLSKNKYKRAFKTKLDIHDIKIILREFSRKTFKTGTIYNIEEAHHLIDSCKEKLPNISFKSSELIYDIIHNVPLFVEEGPKIRWSHKSLQDFFLSEYIVYNSNKEALLNKIYDSKDLIYLNVIDFLFEMDPNYFQKIIIFRFLNDFINYCDSTYTVFKNTIPTKQIRIRQAITFNYLFMSCQDLPYHIVNTQEILGRFKINKNDVRIMLISYKESTEVTAVYFYEPLTNLFIQKKLPFFFKLTSDNNKKIKPQDILKWASNGPIILTDSESCDFNSQNNFNSFNNYLLNNVVNVVQRENEMQGIVLNYDKCVSFLNKINKLRIEDDSDNNDLFN